MIDLSGLNDIQWRHRSADVHADQIPVLLRDAIERDYLDRPEVFGMLSVLLSPDLTLQPQAVDAIPFLIQMVACDDTSIQAEAASVIEAIAQCLDLADDALTDGSLSNRVRLSLLNHKAVLQDAFTDCLDRKMRGDIKQVLSYLDTITPCPSCGERLRSADARQCFHCGHDWH